MIYIDWLIVGYVYLLKLHARVEQEKRTKMRRTTFSVLFLSLSFALLCVSRAALLIKHIRSVAHAQGRGWHERSHSI